MKTISQCVLALCLSGVFSFAFGGVVFNPSPSTPGNYDLIPNGGFELGNTTYFTHLITYKGAVTASTELPFLGSYSGRADSYGYTGPGYALRSDSISVTSGQTYVLSGFMHTGELTSGALYLDLNDSAFDISVSAQIGFNGWQFVWGSFTPTTNYVQVRLVRDGGSASGTVSAVEDAFFDEIGVTPLNSFGAATVPSPGSILLLAVGLLGLTCRSTKT